MPVDLPTVDMLEPASSHTSMSSSSDPDLEAGHGGGMMRQMNGSYSGISTASRPPQASTSNSRDITPTGPTLVSMLSSPPLQQPKTTEIPDLLADSVPSSETDIVGIITQDITTPTAPKSDDSPVLVDHSELSPTTPDSAVRLVGGGGVSGTVDDALHSEGVFIDEADTEEVALDEVSRKTSPAASETATTPTGDKADKRSSISSGLKKIGQLGGNRRKKNSVSSVKLAE